MLPSPLCPPVGQRLAGCGEKQEKKENYDRQEDIWQERNSFVDDFDARLPALKKSIGMTPSGENGREGRLN